MKCIGTKVLVLSAVWQQGTAIFSESQGQFSSQSLAGSFHHADHHDQDPLLLNERGHGGHGVKREVRQSHFKVRLPRKRQTQKHKNHNFDVVPPLDHMKAPFSDFQQFGLRQQIRNSRQNNFFPSNNFALSQQNQAPVFNNAPSSFGGNRPFNRQQGRPTFNQNQGSNGFRPQQNQGSNGFRPQNQGSNGFRPQQFNNNGFRPQQQFNSNQNFQQQNSFQQQSQQSNGFQSSPQQFQNQIQTTRQTFSSSSSTTPSVRSSPVSPTSVSNVPVFSSSSSISDSPSTTTTTTTTTTSPVPSTRAPRVIPPSTRQPRILGTTTQDFFGSSQSNRFIQASQRDREGRAGHAGHDDGYSAPEPHYAPAPPSDYGHKPSYKILKLTGLDTAPIPNFNYMFSTENKINVMGEGELRNVCNEDVTVMKGSYDYYGPDGVKYTVDWYADETGFHPTAAHLPQPVQPNHPEVAAAVKAQLAHAAAHHYRRYRRDAHYAPPPPPCPPPSYEEPQPSYSG